MTYIGNVDNTRYRPTQYGGLGQYSITDQPSTAGFIGDIAWLAVVGLAIYVLWPSAKPAGQRIKKFVEGKNPQGIPH
jgi:hypothetical protein